MSICTPCTRLKDAPLCADSYIIGEVANPNQTYYLYFRSLANDMVVKYQVVSDVNSIISIDTGIFASGMLYEMWVNQGSQYTEGVDLIIDTVTANCFNIAFFNAMGYAVGDYTFELA